MDFLNDVLKAILEKVLGDDYAAFESKINSHNETAKDEDKVKLGNLATGKYVDAGKFDGEVLKLTTERDTLLEQVDGLQGDLEKIKESTGDVDKIKSDADIALKASQDQVKAAQDKAQEDSLDYEIKLGVIAEGAKNATAVIALLDKKKISIHDGKLMGLVEQTDPLKASDAYLFGEKKQVTKTTVQNPPGDPSATDKVSTWQAKLDKARKDGDNKVVISVKQAAMEDGVPLS